MLTPEQKKFVGDQFEKKIAELDQEKAACREWLRKNQLQGFALVHIIRGDPEALRSLSPELLAHIMKLADFGISGIIETWARENPL